MAKHHSGFGIIAQAIVGAVQGIALGSGKLHELSTVEKYLKKEKHTQQLSQSAALEQKRRELASKNRLLQVSGKTELLKDQQLKKLVIIGGGIAVVLTILAFGLIIAFTTGEDEEYE